MKGDFSRVSFDAANHFSRVLLQQGRVTVDADPNEQSAILLHYLRTLARDLIGPYGGPADQLGFALSVDTSVTPPKLHIGAGHYYVDGILCESEGCTYDAQPDYTPLLPNQQGVGGDALLAQLTSPTPQNFWLYLDVWERHITWIEDDRIREVALGGPDTCTRTQVVWQVKALKVDPLDNGAEPDCTAPLSQLTPISLAQMTARLDPGQQIKDPCVISPDARYRGAENQLYRVEVHQGSAPGVTPTFKWSRDNGSVATPWLGTEGNDLLVMQSRGFTAGTWVELLDESNDLNGIPGLLVKLAKVEGDRLSVDQDSVPTGQSIAVKAGAVNPKIRRWDQTANDDIQLADGAVKIEAQAGEFPWVNLEDGIQVRFEANGEYRSGDYWLITARVATGGIDWPQTHGTNGEIQWLPQAPAGVQHHYAPLGFLSWVAGNESPWTTTPCVCTLVPINSCSRRIRDFSPGPQSHAATRKTASK
jgi:hypothetical protein